MDGCEKLAVDHKLYFITLTCRGREIPLAESERSYYVWTNVLLTNARKHAKTREIYWCYVQVTERQKKTRRHPHSHIITTFLPEDARETLDEKGRPSFISSWFSRANESAGLGSQHRISLVESASAVSRYVAKYMFKETMTETFPPKWKRVRYSENFPKLTHLECELAIPLTDKSMWRAAEHEPILWQAQNEVIYQIATHRIGNVIRAD